MDDDLMIKRERDGVSTRMGSVRDGAGQIRRVNSFPV